MNSAGSAFVTVDTQVTTVPTRLYALHAIASVGGDAQVLIKNGGASGTDYAGITATVSTGRTYTFGKHGMFFDSGLYVNTAANTDSVLLTYTAL